MKLSISKMWTSLNTERNTTPLIAIYQYTTCVYNSFPMHMHVGIRHKSIWVCALCTGLVVHELLLNFKSGTNEELDRHRGWMGKTECVSCCAECECQLLWGCPAYNDVMHLGLNYYTYASP